MNKQFQNFLTRSAFAIIAAFCFSASSQAFDFAPDPLGPIFDVSIQNDDQILVAGQFEEIGGLAVSKLARVKPNGIIDSTFNVQINPVFGSRSSFVRKVITQDDGKIIIGGSFGSIGAGNAGFVRVNLARLNSDGSVDQSFSADTNGSITEMVQQADGKLIISGTFTKVGGIATARNTVRLNTDGAIDTSFFSFDSVSPVIKLLPSGKIFVATEATNSRSTSLILRNSDGTVDQSFQVPNIIGSIIDLEVQDDGKVIIAGSIVSVGDRLRSRIARLNIDGTLDDTFSTSFEIRGAISDVEMQADGKMLLSGRLPKILRLNGDGTLDSGFTTRFGGEFNLALQSDGKIIVYNSSVFRDETISERSIVRRNLARINADGSLDGLEDLCLPIISSNKVGTIVCL